MASRKSQQACKTSEFLGAYESLEVIGSGTFGLIRKVRRVSDGQIFARKELKFERMTERDRRQIVAEVNILRNLQHINIVKYEERFVDNENGILYIVMEYCEGGDLGSTIQRCRKTNTQLQEEVVWSLLSQMVCALDACHHRDIGVNVLDVANGRAILHRDLKPENVFLDGQHNVKIGDFGLSKEVAAQDFARTYVGTPYYMSPELATGAPYDTKSDIWALGCVAYELCAHAPPFDATNQAELTRKIKLGHVPQLPRAYSQELGNLIRSMLDLNPKRRPTTKMLLNDPAIRKACHLNELLSASERIAEQKKKLKEQWEELGEAQRALGERELFLHRIFGSAEDWELRLADVARREQAVTTRESILDEKERRLKEESKSKTMELTSPSQDCEVGMKGRSRSREQLRTNRQRAEGATTVNHEVPPARPVTRPHARRIPSGGIARVRASPSSNAVGESSNAVEIVHVKSSGTPRSAKDRARLSSKSGLPLLGDHASSGTRALRRRTESAGSDEWIEDGENSAGAEEDEENHAGPSSPSERPARRLSAWTRKSDGESFPKTGYERVSLEEGNAALYMARRGARAPQLPSVVRAWSSEARLGAQADDSDLSMRDATMFDAPSSPRNAEDNDKENDQSYDESLSTQKRQLAEVQGGIDKISFRSPIHQSGVPPESVTKARPALATRTTVASVPQNGQLKNPEFQHVPVYDLDDEDLPSPFLKKVSREMLPSGAGPGPSSSKPTQAQGGVSGLRKSPSGMVGPSNFLARAAAAGAARQNMATASSTSKIGTTASTLSTAPKRVSGTGAPIGRVVPPSSTSTNLSSTNSSLAAPAPPVRRRASALPGGISVGPLKEGAAMTSRRSYIPSRG